MVKRKWLMSGTSLLLALVLIACNGNDNEEQNQPGDAIENTQNNMLENGTNTGEDTGQDMEDSNTPPDEAAYSFSEFELEIDDANGNEIVDVDYESDGNNDFEASYIDVTQELNFRGGRAMEALDNIFTSFTFDENTADDEVLDTVLDAFGFTDNEEVQVELAITFDSGTEKEYRR